MSARSALLAARSCWSRWVALWDEREPPTLLASILVLSPAGRVWSVDAKLATGSFRGDPAPAPAWARYLILLTRLLSA